MFSTGSELVRARELLSIPSEGKRKAAGRRARELAGDSEARQEWISERFSSICEFAGISREEGMKTCLRAVIGAVAVLSLSIAFRSVYLIPLLPLQAGFEYLRIKRRIGARARNFERDYPALLLSLASAIRTGLDPIVALKESYKLFASDSVICAEIKAFGEKIDRGISESEAIGAFAATIRHPDIDLFRTSLILARKEGSSLSGCLQRLAKVTRQRQLFRRKVKTAVAMQKLSATAIACATAIIGVIQYTANPEGFKEALDNPLGFKFLTGGVGLIVFGLIWMRRMASNKVSVQLK